MSNLNRPLKGILYGMGNPLLDMNTVVDEDYLKKYELSPNNAILAEDKHKPIFDELVDDYNVEYSAGGATQNSIRVAQWFLKEQDATTYVGCIGSDPFGEKMKGCMIKEGIKTAYMCDSKIPTGVCAVLVTGGNRSLVTRLDAANEYKKSHLVTKEVWQLIQEADFFYIAGFFLTVSNDSIIEVGEHSVEENKVFSMNLSAPFLCQFFKEQMQKALPYCDILFGNEDEAKAFAKEFNLNTQDVGQIAQKISALPKKNGKRSRIVIFTQGPEPTIVFKDGKVKEYPVVPIAIEDIVDTNGAGDAFVGGFLAKYVLGCDIDDCVANGSVAAHMIIQRSGCTLPTQE